MRAILIIGFILFGLGFGGYKTYQLLTRSEDDPGPAERSEKDEAGQIDLSGNPVTVQAPEIERRLRLAEDSIEAEREKIRLENLERKEKELRDEIEERNRVKDLAVYQFLNRSVPPVEQLQETFPGVFVDQVSNSILLPVAEKEDAAQMVAAFKLLDSAEYAEQYRVEAILLTAQLLQSEQWSADWLINIADIDSVRGGVMAVAGAPGVVGLANDVLELAIERSSRRGHVAIISRPSVLVTPGSTGVLSSGREVAVPVSNVQDGNVQTSVEFRPVDLSLECGLELIGGLPTLSVVQVNDTITGTAEVSGIDVPEIASQKWTAQLRPSLGEWYAVGGLLQSELEETQDRGFFFLNGSGSKKQRREIGLLIRIVKEVPGREFDRYQTISEHLEQETLPKKFHPFQFLKRKAAVQKTERPQSVINRPGRR